MLTITSLWMLALSTLDPLFSRMAGEWTGEGERIQSISGRRIGLKTRVRSHVEGDRLIYRNQVIESTSAGGEPHEYVRLYWIRATGEAGLYDLGYGSGETEAVSSRGRLDANVFLVEQTFGGEPPYFVRSQTEFLADETTVYLETGWHGETQLSKTRIQYRRVGSESQP